MGLSSEQIQFHSINIDVLLSPANGLTLLSGHGYRWYTQAAFADAHTLEGRVFGGIKAECESISTLNFVFSGLSISFIYHLPLWFPVITLSSSPLSVPSLLVPFAFHGRCLCRSDDSQCLSEAASTVLSYITKTQECSTTERLHLSKAYSTFFLGSHMQYVPLKSPQLGLKRGSKKRQNITCWCSFLL